MKPRFRRLTLQELQGLEKEFIHFLVAQGIPAAEWVKITSTKPQQAEEIIDNFSDMVFESVFQGNLFIVLRQKETLRTFQAHQDFLEERGLFLPLETADFTDESWCNDVLENPPTLLQKYTRTTPYQDRSKDLFLLTEMGGLINDGKLFNLLKALE